MCLQDFSNQVFALCHSWRWVMSFVFTRRWRPVCTSGIPAANFILSLNTSFWWIASKVSRNLTFCAAVVLEFYAFTRPSSSLACSLCTVGSCSTAQSQPSNFLITYKFENPKSTVFGESCTFTITIANRPPNCCIPHIHVCSLILQCVFLLLRVRLGCIWKHFGDWWKVFFGRVKNHWFVDTFCNEMKHRIAIKHLRAW